MYVVARPHRSVHKLLCLAHYSGLALTKTHSHHALQHTNTYQNAKRKTQNALRSPRGGSRKKHGGDFTRIVTYVTRKAGCTARLCTLRVRYAGMRSPLPAWTKKQTKNKNMRYIAPPFQPDEIAHGGYDMICIVYESIEQWAVRKFRAP